MVEFETLKADEIKFGNNNFIEVARKKAVAEEGVNEFIAVSRGFFAPDGSKRFKKSFTVPDQPEVVDFICNKIREMASAEGYVNPAPAQPRRAAYAPREGNAAPMEAEAMPEEDFSQQ